MAFKQLLFLSAFLFGCDSGANNLIDNCKITAHIKSSDDEIRYQCVLLERSIKEDWRISQVTILRPRKGFMDGIEYEKALQDKMVGVADKSVFFSNISSEDKKIILACRKVGSLDWKFYILPNNTRDFSLNIPFVDQINNSTERGVIIKLLP